jgi:hypothetical protein
MSNFGVANVGKPKTGRKLAEKGGGPELLVATSVMGS